MSRNILGSYVSATMSATTCCDHVRLQQQHLQNSRIQIQRQKSPSVFVQQSAARLFQHCRLPQSTSKTASVTFSGKRQRLAFSSSSATAIVATTT
jgi:hypothetical protein